MKVKYNAGEFSIGLLKSALRSYIYEKARKGQVKLKNTQGKVRQLVKTARQSDLEDSIEEIKKQQHGTTG